MEFYKLSKVLQRGSLMLFRYGSAFASRFKQAVVTRGFDLGRLPETRLERTAMCSTTGKMFIHFRLLESRLNGLMHRVASYSCICIVHTTKPISSGRGAPYLEDKYAEHNSSVPIHTREPIMKPCILSESATDLCKKHLI